MKSGKKYISGLYDHINETFRNSNVQMKQIIDVAIFKGLIKGLKFDDTLFPMRGPYCNLREGVIVLQDGFLSYLWTVCYFMLGLTEIYDDKTALGKPITNLMDSEKFIILNNTFAWGRSLKLAEDEIEVTSWPDHIANPSQDELRCLQANQLMVFAATYLMYHEMGHLILHSDNVEYIEKVKTNGYRLSEDDQRRLRMMEIQADIYALDAMFCAVNDEHDRFMRFLAVIIVHLAEFFTREFPNTLTKNYPTLDERLKRIITKIDVQHIGYKMYLESTLTIGLQTFFALTFTEYIPDDHRDFSFENFDDLSVYLFEIIEAWKTKYNSLAKAS